MIGKRGIKAMHLEKVQVRLQGIKYYYGSYTRLTRHSEMSQAVRLMYCSLVDGSVLEAWLDLILDLRRKIGDVKCIKMAWQFHI